MPKKTYQPVLKKIDPQWGYCIDDKFASRVFDRLRKEEVSDSFVIRALENLNKTLENKLLAYVVAEFLTVYEKKKK